MAPAFGIECVPLHQGLDPIELLDVAREAPKLVARIVCVDHRPQGHQVVSLLCERRRSFGLDFGRATGEAHQPDERGPHFIAISMAW